jgi:hypothetical protein
MPDDRSTGDPIPEIFDPNCIDARFVVAMSMARNDIEVSLRDGIAAAQDDRPDFSYRVRLVTSHLVEALDSLNAHSQEEDVKKLIARVPADAQKDLSKARSVLQKVGPKVLEHVRNNAFHVPSPRTNYSPSSDEHFGTCSPACATGRVICAALLLGGADGATASCSHLGTALRPLRSPAGTHFRHSTYSAAESSS